MKFWKKILLAGAALFAGYTIWTWDLTPPRVDGSENPEIIGKSGRIQLRLEDAGKGLRQVEIAVIQGDQRQSLLREEYAGSGWPWQGKTPKRSLAVTLEAAQMPALEEGPFQIEVIATDQPNLWLFSRTTRERRDFTLDLTPPRIGVLSSQHYLRQGGSELVVYRVDSEAAASGAKLGELEFRGYPVADRPGTYAVLVGAAYDLPLNTRLALWAQDLAGNRSEFNVAAEILTGRFRQRRISVSDSFIQSVAPEILQNSAQVEAGESNLETFLAINADLRRLNHEFIRDLSQKSADHFLWDRPFVQLSNSQVEASFADRRTYLYQGKPVDEQTHLGFDLASTAQSPVEASNAGRVLWADYLGIYGNCVILDHGMGLMSLYGHLSSIEVTPDQEVQAGQTLGRTGKTGLAGGDHLHFSMIVQGVHVNPLEWWDPKWLDNHIFGRLQADRPAE